MKGKKLQLQRQKSRKRTSYTTKPIMREGQCIGLKILFALPLPLLLVENSRGQITNVTVEPTFFAHLETQLREAILKAAAQNGI